MLILINKEVIMETYGVKIVNITPNMHINHQGVWTDFPAQSPQGKYMEFSSPEEALEYAKSHNVFGVRAVFKSVKLV